jgi:hypothetical protein
MRTSEWTMRPPATARIARHIWDLLSILEGREPSRLWHNWNGICFGNQMSDADYGSWKRDGGYHENGEDVDEYVIIMAGATMGGMKLLDWYAKFNPKGREYYLYQIGAFKKNYPDCRTYE